MELDMRQGERLNNCQGHFVVLWWSYPCVYTYLSSILEGIYFYCYDVPKSILGVWIEVLTWNKMCEGIHVLFSKQTTSNTFTSKTNIGSRQWKRELVKTRIWALYPHNVKGEKVKFLQGFVLGEAQIYSFSKRVP